MDLSGQRLLLDTALSQDPAQHSSAIARVGCLEGVGIGEILPPHLPRFDGALDVVTEGRDSKRRIRPVRGGRAFIVRDIDRIRFIGREIGPSLSYPPPLQGAQRPAAGDPAGARAGPCPGADVRVAWGGWIVERIRVRPWPWGQSSTSIAKLRRMGSAQESRRDRACAGFSSPSHPVVSRAPGDPALAQRGKHSVIAGELEGRR